MVISAEDLASLAARSPATSNSSRQDLLLRLLSSMQTQADDRSQLDRYAQDERRRARVARRRLLLAQHRELAYRNETLAEIFGACPSCWGELPSCRSCRGEGFAGWTMPDEEALRALVAPALDRLKNEAKPVSTNASHPTAATAANDRLPTRPEPRTDRDHDE